MNAKAEHSPANALSIRYSSDVIEIHGIGFGTTLDINGQT